MSFTRDEISVLSLADDLKRVANFIKNNSFKNVEIFTTEATKWLEESRQIANPSIQKILEKIEKTLKEEDNINKAEDLLMYSTLLQNRSI